MQLLLNRLLPISLVLAYPDRNTVSYLHSKLLLPVSRMPPLRNSHYSQSNTVQKSFRSITNWCIALQKDVMDIAPYSLS